MEITNEQKQVMLSGILGDGSLAKNGSMSFNCQYKEYMQYKKDLLGDLVNKEVKETVNTGYKEAPIFSISAKVNEYGKYLNSVPLSESIRELDELGLALWLYDDGSRHKKHNFFNINTHAFDIEIEENIFIPLLNKFGIFPTIMAENKKDGRSFTYLYVEKYKGSFIIADILSKYPVNCYSYKIVPEEIRERFKFISNTFKGVGIKKATLTHIINKPVDDFENFIKTKISVNKQGVVSVGGENRYKIDGNEIIL